MNRVLLVSLIALSSLCRAADDFAESVPIAVVEQVLASALGTDAQLHAGIMAGFPDFEVPQGMAVLASLDQGYQQRVILTTRFDHEAASALAYGALFDAGWQLVLVGSEPRPQTGFINPTQPQPVTELCHPDHGIMQVATAGGVPLTQVHLTRRVTPPGQPAQRTDCVTGETTTADQQPASTRMVGSGPEIAQYVPRLVLPEDDGMTAPMAGYGGGGGSNAEWEVRAVLRGSWDITRVFRHFTDQIAAQGWQDDAEVIGAEMASGSWTKTAEDGVALIGNLVVIITGDATFDVRFRMLRKDPAVAAGPRAAPIGVSEVIRDRR